MKSVDDSTAPCGTPVVIEHSDDKRKLCHQGSTWWWWPRTWETETHAFYEGYTCHTELKVALRSVESIPTS